MFKHFIPVDLRFGVGALEQLGKTRLPGKKALLVMTSGKSLKNNGTLDRVLELLKKNNVETVLFDRIQPNPTLDSVNVGGEMARKNGCDFVIGLGGGSPVDSAKSIAVAAVNDGDYWDYVGAGSGKRQKAKNALPIVAIPTTAGTGTETDPWTVVTKEDTNEKIGSGWNFTFPALSIVDPELMVSIPPHLTAYQGFDAFFHAAEGFLANIHNPMSDLYAGMSLSLLYKSLVKAVKNGKDIEARTDVALASTVAGMVESTSSCISEHSMEHAMSAYYSELPHGAGLIMLSRAYFEFFAAKVPDRVGAMAEVMLSKPGATAGDFLAAMAEMQDQCGVGGLKMSDYGIKEADLPKFAVNARETMGGLFTLDPVELSNDDVVGIYKKSYR